MHLYGPARSQVIAVPWHGVVIMYTGHPYSIIIWSHIRKNLKIGSNGQFGTIVSIIVDPIDAGYKYNLFGSGSGYWAYLRFSNRHWQYAYCHIQNDHAKRLWVISSNCWRTYIHYVCNAMQVIKYHWKNIYYQKLLILWYILLNLSFFSRVFLEKYQQNYIITMEISVHYIIK